MGLHLKAPAHTRFLIGAGDQGANAVPCDFTVLDEHAVPYQVGCPEQSPGQKRISIISRGDFDYGFTKPLN
ncbi:hypothetical protein [Paeniglutamicibacter sp.]|uniref:hypothetical protein n=1 Tax=Paeniglutamicibacter sp. TaxID=1934391 RepID=UPI003989BFF0